MPVPTPTERGELVAGALRGEGRRVRFRRGQALFTEGDIAERVFIIERGWVMISSIAPGGREIVLGIRGPGDVIGDLSALDGSPRSATAIAVGDVEATVAPGSAFTRALTDAGTAMELPLSQEQLASWCGASREATVKALATLRSLGCIATGRRSVQIRNADALRRHARGAV